MNINTSLMSLDDYGSEMNATLEGLDESEDKLASKVSEKKANK